MPLEWTCLEDNVTYSLKLFYNFAFDFKELGLCQTWLLFFDLNIWASGCYCLDSITRNWPVLLDQKGKDSLEEQVELNLFTKKKKKLN